MKKYILLVFGILGIFLLVNAFLSEGEISFDKNISSEAISNTNVIENGSSIYKEEMNNLKAEVISTKKSLIYQENPVLANNEFIVCIDPGHQAKGNSNLEPIGPGSNVKKPKVSSGTKGVFTGKPEYVLALEATLFLKEELESKGIKVVLTRESHDIDISNKERAEMANSIDADLFIRIHADGANDSSAKGFHILLPSSNGVFTKNIYEPSKYAGISILDNVKNKYGIRGNGISYREDLSGFNWSKVPTVLLEMGFMTNKEDDLNLSDEKYLKDMMKNVSNGIYEYLTQKNNL